MRFLLAIIICIIAGKDAYSQSIVINEIMYAPGKSEPEWAELYNYSDSTIIIEGWSISDLLKAYGIPNASIPPKEYVVLTKDSLLLVNKYLGNNIHILQMPMPSLNNTGDQIIIKDSQHHTIDSLT